MRRVVHTVMSNEFKSLSDEVKPRERILAEGGASANYELLAVLLKTGAAGCDVMELSRRLISAFGSVSEMVKCDLLMFRETVKRWNVSHPEKRILGLGTVKMLELLAAFEFVRRGCGEDARTNVDSLDDLVKMFCDSIRGDFDQEHFMVVPLDSDNRVLRPPVCLAKGLHMSVVVDARELFARALRWYAASVVVAHNHPDGDTAPSEADVSLTKRLVEAGRLLGVEVMDHLIVNDRCEFSSLAELGLIG